ncbi:kinase-like protein [Polyporus arcularius HHB13444]|uniref:non-specific serine/threonine protein kinase n=1 Tax=Polyporus arcularius HHB13444 TaxID=1314778 RepID=A0A5C3PV51_9APHY|nr:kinase-like protein [Polyporus arcularius HHB13444]
MRLHFLPDLPSEGGFARVYRAYIMGVPGKVVAVKQACVADHVEHPRLLHEGAALVLLRGHPNIPLAYAWGRSQYYEYLAMELLSVDLADSSIKLTMRNLVALAIQMLDVIEHVHSHGIVHCDVKTQNFMLSKEDPGRLRLIDFGLCRPYRNPVTLSHLPDVRMQRSIGTDAFVSLHGHLRHSPSRRDDMESLSYTLLALLLGDLPWAPGWKYLGRTRLYESKKDWSGTQLIDCPSAFGEFVDYTRALGYTDAPDYAYWKRRFRELCADLPAQPFYDPEDTGKPLPKRTSSGNHGHGSRAHSTSEDEDRLHDRLADVAGVKLSKMLEVEVEPSKPSEERAGIHLSKIVRLGKDEDEPHDRLTDSAGVELPKSAPWHFIDTDFIPCSDWPVTFSLDDDELLGNEEEIVCAHLDILEELPSGQEQHVEDCCPPEIMHTAPRTRYSEGASAAHKYTNSKSVGSNDEEVTVPREPLRPLPT